MGGVCGAQLVEPRDAARQLAWALQRGEEGGEEGVRARIASLAGPMSERSQRSLLVLAIEHDRLAALRALLDAWPSARGCGELLQLAANKGAAEAIDALLFAGVRPDERVGRAAFDSDLRRCPDLGPLPPACLAAMHGHAPAFARLVAAGDSIEWRDAEGATLLWRAAQQGNARAVELALFARAKVEAHVKGDDRRRQTPLQIAAAYGHARCVQLLREAGADANVRDAEGATPLHIAAWRNHASCVTALLTAGKADIDINAHDKNSGATALHYACELRNLAIVGTLLQRGADARARDDKERTPAHIAATSGFAEGLRLLLAAGARADDDDADGWTPLHNAAQENHVEAIRVLAAAGAAPDARNSGGRMPLHVAAARGQLAAVEALLTLGAPPDDKPAQRGANVYPYSPLVCALHGGHVEVVRRLLQAGANVEWVSLNSQRPLHEVVTNTERRAAAVAELLLSHGADPNSRDWRSYTPLHAAAEEGLPDLIVLLLERGASDSARDRDGKLPRDLVSRPGARRALAWGARRALLLPLLVAASRGDDAAPFSASFATSRLFDAALWRVVARFV